MKLAQRVSSLLICYCVLAMTGCGESVDPGSATPEESASMEVKMQALMMAQAINASPATGAGPATQLSVTIANIGDDAGEQKAKMDQLKTLADELTAIYASERPSISAIKKKAEEISTLAKQLPGDVPPELTKGAP